MLERENVVNILSGNPTNQSQDFGDVPNYNSQIFQDPRGQARFADLKNVFVDIFFGHSKFCTYVINTCVVFILTITFTRLLSSKCFIDNDVFISEANVFCDPYYPLDRVVVDIDLNTTSHCYGSKSCVALGKTLQEDQGKFRYNFIIGAFGFIYMQHGYTCQSEALEDALYIRLPVDSIYNGQDFMAARMAVSKLNEILREGLECGKIQKNYTITAKGCGKFNDWCSKMLYELVSEDPSDRFASGPRIDYYDHIKPGTFFNPLNLNRVYSYQYKLVVCTEASGKL